VVKHIVSTYSGCGGLVDKPIISTHSGCGVLVDNLLSLHKEGAVVSWS
jgi:hypothetical protein